MYEYVVIGVTRALSELLINEPSFLPQLRGRIDVIQMRLRQLQAILEIADARQVDDGIHNWVVETREVAYDIEDLMLEAAVFSKKEDNLIKRYNPMFKEATSLYDLDLQIKSNEAKISSLLSDLRVRSMIPHQRGMPDPASQRREQLRKTYSHNVEEDFVGLDEEIVGLVEKIVKGNNNNYQVVAITGMGGIGKTTIAKKIYHHSDIRSHFDGFAWVCVSQQWQQEDVLQRILNKLEPEKKEDINKMKVDDLVEELYRVQQRKKCLIVLDDVWENDVWDVLNPAFPNRLTNSILLITTRNKEIACHIKDVEIYHYEQRHLNENESWELLKKKVFRGLQAAGLTLDRSRGGDGVDEGETEYSSGFEDDDASSSADSFKSCNTDEIEDEGSVQGQINPMYMEKLGKDMVGQCAGLPLAIIVLGGVLMTKTTISEWRMVHQNFNTYLRMGSNSRYNGRVHEVLALSYHDLPYHLKPCFLHLGNFPEDLKIPTRKLYQLWAAEGFISPESYQAGEEESVMEIAERYLGELAQRCMVQVSTDEATGRFKSCQLHDLTRELCLLKVKEELFLKKVPTHYEAELLSYPLSSARATLISFTRRLSIVVDNEFESYFPPKKEKLEKIRSAMFFSRHGNKRNFELTLLDLICDAFKLLRVLDLERFDFGTKLSKPIGNLVYLRYLSLRGSTLDILPSSLGKLKYLQTLDLRVRTKHQPFSAPVTIPNVICKLNHLKHLYLPPIHMCTSKLDLSTLRKMEILKNFETRVSDYRDITKLSKLQKLAAILTLGIEDLAAIISSLGLEHNHIKDTSFRIRYDFKSERELHVLRKLVGSTHLRKLDLVGQIKRLPEHCHFGQRLTKLTLRWSRLEKDPMATLEKLPSLYSLIIRKNGFDGNAICCSRKGFPRLRILELRELISLEYWIIEEGAMPNLYSLTIGECTNLRMIPEGIKHVSTLKELVIANMPDAFKSRVQKVGEEGGEDSHKVGHIPSITFTETNISSVKEFTSQLSGRDLFKSISPKVVPKQW